MARANTGWLQTWGAYWLPMLAFLIVVTFGESAPDAAEPWVLVLRTALPAGCIRSTLRRLATTTDEICRLGVWYALFKGNSGNPRVGQTLRTC